MLKRIIKKTITIYAALEKYSGKPFFFRLDELPDTLYLRIPGYTGVGSGRWNLYVLNVVTGDGMEISKDRKIQIVKITGTLEPTNPAYPRPASPHYQNRSASPVYEVKVSANPCAEHFVIKDGVVSWFRNGATCGWQCIHDWNLEKVPGFNKKRQLAQLERDSAQRKREFQAEICLSAMCQSVILNKDFLI